MSAGNSSAAIAGIGRDAALTLADGTRFAFAVTGDLQAARARPVVLLVHGLASNRSRWTEFAAHSTLAQRHALLRVDLRGHGDSPFAGPLSLERWCDDLIELLDAAGARRAIVVGHSLGAQVALAFAARHRQRAAALALIDPVFRSALVGRWRLIARASPLFAIAAALVRAANALGLRRSTVVPYDLVELDARARTALGSREDEQAFIRQYSSTRADLRHFRTAHYLRELVEMFRPTPPLRTLDLPVLVLLSTGATFADTGAMREELAALPDGEIVWIDCHHWPLTERPAEVRETIERWCDGLGDDLAGGDRA